MTEIIDHTPLDFNPTEYRNQNTVKRRVLDQIVYPLSTRLTTCLKVLAYPELSNISFSTDRILFGDRGSGFISLVKILNRFVSFPTSNVLIQGCGLGQEALAWSKMRVSSCVGIDQFNFKKAWQQITEATNGTQVSFLTGNICQTELPHQSFDIISSFAVWEHVKDFDALVKESKRLIKPKGVVLSGFGPLWYTFSGDHFSAAGGIETGFNHLLLSQADYFEWIDSFQRQDSWATSQESYFEIRRHIHEGMFSYLRPRDYIQKVEEHFTRLYTIAVISPEALIFKESYPDKWKQLINQDNMLEEDLLIRTIVLFLAPLQGY